MKETYKQYKCQVQPGRNCTYSWPLLVNLLTESVWCVCSAMVLVRPNGHLLSPELGSSSFSGGAGTSGVIRTGLYPRSTPSTALYYTNSTPRVNAADLTQPSLQAGQDNRTFTHLHSAMTKACTLCPKKHMTTFSTITLTISVRLQ